VHRSLSPRFSFVRWSLWSNVTFPARDLPFPFHPSWHPFARHAASRTSARGLGLYRPVAYLSVVTVMKTGEKEWHLMQVTFEWLEACHWST
jgi:hypothetical protein